MTGTTATTERIIAEVKATPFPTYDFSDFDYSSMKHSDIDYLISALLKSYRNSVIKAIKEGIQ